MATINEEARIPVYINDEQAKQALKNLTAEAEKWRQKMHEAQVSGDMKAMKDAQRELKNTQTAAEGVKKAAFDVNAVLAKISTASTKDLNKALQAINREMVGLNRGTKEYQALAAKKSLIKDEFTKINGSITKQVGLLGQLKNLLPAMGFAAMAGVAVGAFTKIKDSTDTLQDAWEETMGSMKSASDYFFTSLATGDFSNFTKNMKEAIKLGKEYAITIDNIGDRRLGLEMDEAKMRAKNLELEETMKNKELDKTARIAAADERLANEEGFTAKRTAIAQEAYDNEIKNNIKLKDLGKERLEQLLTEVNNTQTTEDEKLVYKERKQADEYAATKLHYEKMKEFNVKTTMMPGLDMPMTSQLPDTPEMKEMLKTIGAYPAAIKDYGEAIIKLGSINDTERLKVKETFVALKEAEDSGAENTKKIRTLRHTLIAGFEVTGQKLEDGAADKSAKAKKEASDKAIQALDTENNKRMALLVNRYTNEGLSDANFKNEQDKLEIEYLFKKQASLQAHGQSTVDIDKQINDKRIQSQKEFNDAMAKAEADYQKQQEDQPITAQDAGIDPASMVTPEDLAFAAQKHSLDEWVDYLTKKTKEQIDIKTNALKNEKAIQQARNELTDVQIEGIGQIAGAMAGMFEKGSAAQIAFFAIEKAMAIAQVWVNYARESSAIAVTAAEMNAVSFGVAGTAWAAIMEPKALINAGINTALIAAQAVAQVASSNKGYVSGGYTGPGQKYEPKGIVHGDEYVIPTEGYNNPKIRPIIDLMEIARRNGSLARLDLRPVVAQVMSGKNYSDGGEVGSGRTFPTTSHPELVSGSPASGVTDQTAKKFTDAVDRLLTWDPSISIETYERKKKNWEKTTTGGLK